MPMQCQEEYLPGQILQKHVMQCWFLPMVCRSQGINNCYNHCPSTFVNPWFILPNWRVMVPTTLWFWLIFYIHLWHGICFPWQPEFETTSSKADVYPRPRLDTWRTALPSGSVIMLISVGILLEFLFVVLIDSPISIHFHRDFNGFSKIFRRSS